MSNIVETVVCGVGLMLAVGLMSSNNSASAYVSEADRIVAAQIQHAELNKYNHYSSSISSVKSKIRSNESRISYLEKTIRANLDTELATLLQIEESLKLEKSNCSWYDTYRLNSIEYRINTNKHKMSSVKIKIKKNEEEIKRLKKVRTELDSELATLLQLQESNLHNSYWY